MKRTFFLTVKLVIANILLLVSMNTTQAQKWQLSQCIDTALVHNKTLKIAENENLINDQRNKEAKANLIPKLVANGEYKYYTDLPYQLMPLSVFGGPEGQFKEAQFGVPHNINLNVQLQVPLYNPQAYGAIKATSIAAEMGDIQYRKKEEVIILEVTNLYYNAQLLDNQLRFIDSSVYNLSSLLQNVTLAHKHLLVQKTDVDRVALKLEVLKSQRSITDNKYQQVINGLKFIMGLSLQRNIEIDPGIVFEKNDELAYLASLDLQLTQSKNKLLNNELTTLKRSRLPSVSLFGSYGTTGYGYHEAPNEFLNFYPIGQVGLKVRYPLFNGTVTQRKINQKKLEITNSEIKMAFIDEQQTMMISNARLELEAMRIGVENSEKQMTLAQSIYHSTEVQRSKGVSTLNDVLMADVALKEAQQNYLKTVIDYLTAEMKLKKLTGNNLK